MQEIATKKPKHRKVNTKNQYQNRTSRQKTTNAFKKLLRYLLLRPSTWKFLMVKVPEIADYIAVHIHHLIDWLSS